MSSILTNASALSALQALSSTQSSLATVQDQVSTGLRVATAKDNSAYWSIAAQLNQDNGVIKATNDALSVGQSVLSTASSAIASLTSTLNAMASALTNATATGSNLTSINTSLASLGAQLTDAVNNASFNGLNVLNNTSSGAAITSVDFVSGYNATSTGGTINTITLTLAAGGGVYTPSATAGTAGTGLLVQSGTDLTQLGATGFAVINSGTATAGTNVLAKDALTAVNAALTAVTNYAATIGATQTRMTAASTFNTSLSTNYANGISALVDADMNEASTRLQALQTQEQLGIQSLSVANQNAQLILKLFS